MDQREAGSRRHLTFLRGRLLVDQSRTGKLPARLIDLLPAGVVDPGFAQDAWGQAIEYTHGVSSFRLRSAGADKRMGTADDLVLEGSVAGTARAP